MNRAWLMGPALVLSAMWLVTFALVGNWRMAGACAVATGLCGDSIRGVKVRDGTP
jgi:hypothetical protein